MCSGHAKVCNNIQKYATIIQSMQKINTSMHNYENVSIIYKICSRLQNSAKIK